MNHWVLFLEPRLHRTLANMRIKSKVVSVIIHTNFEQFLANTVLCFFNDVVAIIKVLLSFMTDSTQLLWKQNMQRIRPCDFLQMAISEIS